MNSPQTLLSDVFWRFDGEPFATEAEFNAAIREYQACGWDRHDWDPSAVVLPASKMRLRYEFSRKRRYQQKTVELEAATDGAFRAGELLFQIHNSVVSDLHNLDHRYFEGLRLVEAPEKDVPLYRMILGS